MKISLLILNFMQILDIEYRSDDKISVQFKT